MIILITFDLKKPPRLGKIDEQTSRSFLDIQPSGHLNSKIRPTCLGLPTRFIALSDGPVTLLAGRAALRAKSIFGLAQLVPLPVQSVDHHGILVRLLLMGCGLTLSLPPKIPLHLQIVQDLDSPLTGLYILLEQLIPLL